MMRSCTDEAPQETQAIPPPALETDKAFEICSCGAQKGPHGYFTKNGVRLPITIVSERAGNWLLAKLVEEGAVSPEESVLLAAQLKANLPAEVDGDIEVAERSVGLASAAISLEELLFGLSGDGEEDEDPLGFLRFLGALDDEDDDLFDLRAPDQDRSLSF